jgi:dipeptidyl aminopeptidase/acylaminoacyl peptidase
VQAVCSYLGPTDLTSLLGETMIKNFVGTSLQQDPDAFLRASPIYYVGAADPPLLMINGSMDMLVPVGQAKEMLEAYRKQGLDARLIVVKNAGHGLVQAGSQPISPSQEEYERSTIEFFMENLLR